MSAAELDLALGASQMRFVPSVHYRVAFAEEVNALCRDPASRPDAIAVELGPRLAAAARQWMVELGIGDAQRTRLPCMLGFMKRNRHLRPSVRERAQRLQEETGQELQDLPPEVLHRELGYAAAHIAPLSPTDSIVEAIRCSIELGVPLLGVDLDDRADTPSHGLTIEDPTAARGEVSRYVLANAPYADRLEECEVIARREAAIAARLKAVASGHRRVLVVCGLAHWRRLVTMLRDDALPPATRDVRPAAAISSEELIDIRRVVVEPGVACRYMDLFPAVATAYEQARTHPLLGGRGSAADCRALLRHILLRACRNHLVRGVPESPNAPLTSDLEALKALEGLLRSYALVSLRLLPDLGMIMTCARSMMSDGFCEALMGVLMDFPWARPGDFNSAGTVESATGSADGVPMVKFTDRGDRAQERIVLNPHPVGSDKRTWAKFAWSWDGPPRPEAWTCLEGFNFTWTPWENLVTAMCLRAIGMARKRSRRPCPEPFAGQVLDGIDLKSTLRAFARGEDRFYVRNTRPTLVADGEPSAEGFPVVWIFDTAAAGEGSWHTYYEYLEWFLPFVRFPERVQRLQRQEGARVAEVIGFGQSAPNAEQDGLQAAVRCDEMRGLLFFAPLFSATRQYATWFERCDYRSAPIFSSLGRDDMPLELIDRCERLGMRLDRLSWQVRLIAMALALADGAVTIVAPSAFVVDQGIRRLASRRAVRLNLIALQAFPADLVRRMTLNYMVSGVHDGRNGTPIYDEDEVALLGEARERYRSLVPPAWLNFGLI